MPLRKRVSLAAAVAVGAAVMLAVMASYLIVRNQLQGQVDTELRAQASAILQGKTHSLDQQFAQLPASAGGPAPYGQIVLPNGAHYTQVGNINLPDVNQAAAVASGTAPPYMTDIRVNGAPVRMYTFQVHIQLFQSFGTAALQLARPLGPTERILSKLRLLLLLILAGGIALAWMLGRMAARRVLSPLSEVTQTAEVIGETDDLSLRLAVHADDEVGQLARRFNAMLERLSASREALDDSVRSQRQLVADASHELRTPVTSLRTNIEVLLAGGELDDEERRQLLDDVVEQSEELSTLVSDLIEVARGDLHDEAIDDVRLDHVMEEALARAHRNAPSAIFQAQLDPVIIRGNPERLTRAINNLLDNAIRHNAPGQPVEVRVDTQGVRVRDHGTGIEPDDLPYIFDRFYRGANSRARQGSGLGLAIVRQVAESHGGSAAAANAPDGGAIFTLHLTGRPADAPPAPSGGLYDAGGLTTRA